MRAPASADVAVRRLRLAQHAAVGQAVLARGSRGRTSKRDGCSSSRLLALGVEQQRRRRGGFLGDDVREVGLDVDGRLVCRRLPVRRRRSFASVGVDRRAVVGRPGAPHDRSGVAARPRTRRVRRSTPTTTSVQPRMSAPVSPSRKATPSSSVAADERRRAGSPSVSSTPGTSTARPARNGRTSTRRDRRDHQPADDREEQRAARRRRRRRGRGSRRRPPSPTTPPSQPSQRRLREEDPDRDEPEARSARDGGALGPGARASWHARRRLRAHDRRDASSARHAAAVRRPPTRSCRRHTSVTREPFRSRTRLPEE